MAPPISAEFQDLLEIWHELSPLERKERFKQLPHDQTDELFLSLNAHEQSELLDQLPEGERRLWIRLLPPDDAAELIRVSPPKEHDALMTLLDDTTRREVSALLAYSEDVAGGLMNPRFARVRPDMNVDEAIAYVRRQAREVETIYYIYVLDAEQRLQGVASFRDLFSADRIKPIKELMRTRFVSATEEMDQEQLANLFATHHLLAIPVLDANQIMKGIVTIDDIVHVVQQEFSEDIQKIGGSEALDEPYLHISFLRMIRQRGGWLSALFLGEMLTATAMGFFEHEIAKAVVLALFIPLIISSGGNSGSQATTLVIRAMAMGEVRLADWWRVVRREIGAGLALGLILGSIGVARILIWQTVAKPYGEHYMLVALTVGFSLIGVVLFGTIAGSMLPFLLRRLGLDPASASAPFVATLVDVTGLVIYFSIASLVMSGTLL